jgi:signal peptidase II
LVPAEPSQSLRFVASRRLLIALGVITVVLDQGTKAAVRALLPLYDSVSVIPGFLDFTYVQNTGAAFGLLNSADLPFKPAIMTVVALTALVAISVYAMKTSSQDPLGQIGLALVMGGAVGNLIDRVTTGYVVDFVDAYWGNWHFWAFNVADAAITVGACLLILDMMLVNRHVSETI